MRASACSSGRTRSQSVSRLCTRGHSAMQEGLRREQAQLKVLFAAANDVYGVHELPAGTHSRTAALAQAGPDVLDGLDAHAISFMRHYERLYGEPVPCDEHLTSVALPHKEALTTAAVPRNPLNTPLAQAGKQNFDEVPASASLRIYTPSRPAQVSSLTLDASLALLPAAVPHLRIRERLCDAGSPPRWKA